LLDAFDLLGFATFEALGRSRDQIDCIRHVIDAPMAQTRLGGAGAINSRSSR
jgi:hypothetical protein